MGVVSDGGVHGHIAHVLAAAEMITDAGVPVAIHAITDGRDVPPKSADGFVADLVAKLPEGAHVATVIGRYYAMDRDNRWERVALAYDAMIHGLGEECDTAEAAVAAAYARDETDEFILPSVIADPPGIRDGDGFFCLNFRADRAREILRAIGEPGFDEFDTGTRPKLAALLGMVDYSTRHNAYMTTAYPKQQVVNTLAEWVAAHGLRQFHIAETEKYPHVTFFLNGGKETPEEGEERYMAPSPKVATYDLQPEMSAAEVTDHLVAAIHERYDLIVVNYANPDMVGHTGGPGRGDGGLRGGGHRARPGAGGAGGRRRRDDRHRRPRQLRDHGRSGHRRAAYRAYHQPGAGGAGRRAAGGGAARRAAGRPGADAACS